MEKSNTNENTVMSSPYQFEGRIPLKQAIPLGLQHVLAMFVGNLTPILIITAACGAGDFASIQVSLLQNAMLIAGIVTLVQLYAVGPVGGKVPIIMVTAKSTELDKVKGLDQGADDYLTKPFGIMELISRVKALLRRTQDTEETAVISSDQIVMDMDKRTVNVGGNLCELTYKEFELLKMLLVNRGIVLTRDRIMDQVWGFEYEGESRTVDMHIKTLRQKLGEAGSTIKTVRNVGYVIEK